MGSARALERLCNSHDVYRWLCGGVSARLLRPALAQVSDSLARALLDRLLGKLLRQLSARPGASISTRSPRAGCRIRASAGAASTRRKATLDRHLATAEAVVNELRTPRSTRDRMPSNARITAQHQGASGTGTLGERLRGGAGGTRGDRTAAPGARRAARQRQKAEGAARFRHGLQKARVSESRGGDLPPGLRRAGGQRRRPTDRGRGRSPQ